MRLKRSIARLMRRFPFLYPLLVYLVQALAARFTVGVSGVVFNSRGDILLLEHVFRGAYPWGLPGGWVRRRERPQDALRRELLEEVGLAVRVGRPILIELDGPPGHLETAFLCEVEGETKHLSSEVLATRWVSPNALPDGLYWLDREMVAQALAFRGEPPRPRASPSPTRPAPHSIRPLAPGDIPHLAGLDYEITSPHVLVLEKEEQGLEATWRLRWQDLKPPFRSTGFSPTPQEWAALRRNLAAGRREGFVAEVERQPVALIELELQAWRNVGFIWNLLVHRPYRHQGIGSALIQAAVAWAQGHRLRALALETQTNNWVALNFYHRMGFRLCGLDDHYYTNRDREAGEVALFWYRELEGTDGG